MSLGSDLPANFSDQYFHSYAQDAPAKYSSFVDTERNELNEALEDRLYGLAANMTFGKEDDSLQKLSSTYIYAPARRAPFLAKFDSSARRSTGMAM